MPQIWFIKEYKKKPKINQNTFHVVKNPPRFLFKSIKIVFKTRTQAAFELHERIISMENKFEDGIQ